MLQSKCQTKIQINLYSIKISNSLFEFETGRMSMKSLVDGRGALTEGGLGAKTTKVGDDVWDVDISRWQSS